MRQLFQDHILPILASIVLYCTVAPCVLTILALNEILRIIIYFLIGCKYSHGKVKLVPYGIDGCFISQEKSSSTTAMAIIRFKKKKFQFAQFFERVESRIINFQDENGVYVFDKFKWILVKRFGYPCWKLDEQFDLKNHIKTAGGDKKSECDLKMYMSQISHDFDDSKPQWEFILYDYKGVDFQSNNPMLIECSNFLISFAFLFSDSTSKNRRALLIRINHAYMDGFSTLQVIYTQLSTDKDAKPFIDPLKYKLNEKIKFLLYTNLIFKGPYYLVSGSLQKLCKIPWKSIEKAKTGNRYYSWLNDPVELETINKIRSKAGRKKIGVNQV